MARKTIKVPSQQNIRTQKLMNKDLTFTPKINEVSKKLDKEATKNYENLNALDFLLSQPTSRYDTKLTYSMAKLKEKPINLNNTTNSMGFQNSSTWQSNNKDQFFNTARVN